MDADVDKFSDIPFAIVKDIIATIVTGQPQGFVWALLLFGVAAVVWWLWEYFTSR